MDLHYYTLLALLHDLQNGALKIDSQYYISNQDFNKLLDQIEYIKIFRVKLGSTTSIIKKKSI